MSERHYCYDTYKPNRNTKAVVTKKENTPLSIGQWIGIFILTAIPLVNLVCLVVWSFQRSITISKKNYARALLILFVAVWVILAIAILVMTFAFNIDFMSILSGAWEK